MRIYLISIFLLTILYCNSQTDRSIDSTIQYLDRSLESDPHNVYTLLLYGNAVYEKTKDSKLAISYYKKAIQYSHLPYYDANFNIGILFFNDGVYDSAFNYIQNAFKIDSNHENIRLIYSKLHVLKGNVERAIQILNGDMTQLCELAIIAKEHEKYKSAMILAEKALQMDSNDSKANYIKGIVLARYHNKIRKGIPFLEKAIKLNPENANWKEDLAVAYGMTGQYSKTIPLLMDVIRLLPDEPSVYNNLATSYMKLNNKKKADYYMDIYEKMINDVKAK